MKPLFQKLRYSFLIYSLAGIISETPAWSADETIPRAYPSSRYEFLSKKSPFSLSSSNPESTATFTDNMALAGIIKINGEYFAAILDKGTQKRKLISAVPDEEGLKLQKVEFSDDLSKVVIILQKGGEISTLRYDTASLHSKTGESASGTTTKIQAANPPGSPNSNSKRYQAPPVTENSSMDNPALNPVIPSFLNAPPAQRISSLHQGPTSTANPSSGGPLHPQVGKNASGTPSTFQEASPSDNGSNPVATQHPGENRSAPKPSGIDPALASFIDVPAINLPNRH